MIVYFVAIIDFLACLWAVPLCGVFFLTTEGRLRFGAGIGAFEKRFALRRARKAKEKPAVTQKSRHGKHSGMGWAWRILTRLRGATVTLSGSLGLGDAAATALAWGALQALAAGLGPWAARVRIDVSPRFDAELRVELRGMIRVRAGQIMIAAARGGIDALNRRIAIWKNIPSKAS